MSSGNDHFDTAFSNKDDPNSPQAISFCFDDMLMFTDYQTRQKEIERLWSITSPNDVQLSFANIKLKSAVLNPLFVFVLTNHYGNTKPCENSAAARRRFGDVISWDCNHLDVIRHISRGTPFIKLLPFKEIDAAFAKTESRAVDIQAMLENCELMTFTEFCDLTLIKLCTTSMTADSLNTLASF